MSADNELVLGRYYPKPGDSLLGEQLITDSQHPDVVHVDQVAIDIDGVEGDIVRVRMTTLTEDAIDTGRQYSNQAPISDIVNLRFGMYEITKRLGVQQQTPYEVERDWRVLRRLQAKGMLG